MTQDTPLAIISVARETHVVSLRNNDNDDDDETQFKPTIIAHCKLLN